MYNLDRETMDLINKIKSSKIPTIAIKQEPLFDEYGGIDQETMDLINKIKTIQLAPNFRNPGSIGEDYNEHVRNLDKLIKDTEDNSINDLRQHYDQYNLGEFPEKTIPKFNPIPEQALKQPKTKKIQPKAKPFIPQGFEEGMDDDFLRQESGYNTEMLRNYLLQKAKENLNR